MLNVRSHSSRSLAIRLPPPLIPALLNSRWTQSVACCAATSSRKRSTSASRDTSARCEVRRTPCGNPAAWQSCAVSARPRAETSHIATWQPWATSWRTSSRPMPDPPPVTTAILPENSFIDFLPEWFWFSPRSGWSAGADRGFEAGFGVRTAGEGADDWHIDARLPIRLDPGAALLRVTRNACRVDHRVAHGLLAGCMVATLPCLGDRGSLGGKAVLGHHPVVPRKE